MTQCLTPTFVAFGALRVAVRFIQHSSRTMIFLRHKIGSKGRRSRGSNPTATRVARKEKTHHKGVFSFLVAGVGFEPHDLRVMSPTSYRTAPSRDIMVPEAGVEPVRERNLTGF